VTGLPPELLRKGRFDEIFFVDLPNEEEQPKILQAALAANGRAQHAIGLGAGSARCEQFTGAEIAAIVPEAMFVAFADGGREITTEDLIAATKTVVPLVKPWVINWCDCANSARPERGPRAPKKPFPM